MWIYDSLSSVLHISPLFDYCTLVSGASETVLKTSGKMSHTNGNSFRYDMQIRVFTAVEFLVMFL